MPAPPLSAKSHPYNPCPSHNPHLRNRIADRYGHWSPLASLTGVILMWVVVAVVSYRHVLLDLIHQWQTNPSYSHGILVIPLAVWLLWHRRATCPHRAARPWLAGVGVYAVGPSRPVDRRVLSFSGHGRWSIPIWLSGFIGLAWGRPTLVWSLPSVVFLPFMIPIPFQLELLGNQFMQWSSAWCSCYLLGLTSTFAVTDGSALMMPSGRIGISAACSGLRMTVAIAALGYLLAFVQGGRTKRLLTLALLVVPAAIFSNAVRIAVIAWAMHSYQVPSLAGLDPRCRRLVGAANVSRSIACRQCAAPARTRASGGRECESRPAQSASTAQADSQSRIVCTNTENSGTTCWAHRVRGVHRSALSGSTRQSSTRSILAEAQDYDATGNGNVPRTAIRT